MGKTDKKEALNIPIMILCIVGVVLIVFGFLVLKNDNFKLNIIGTQGTIVGTQIKQTAEGVVESRAINISYVANNNSYNATIQNYPEELDIGDKITLYYDLLSPESVSEKRAGYIGYLCAIIGAILVIKTGPRFVRIIRDNYL